MNVALALQPSNEADLYLSLSYHLLRRCLTSLGQRANERVQELVNAMETTLLDVVRVEDLVSVLIGAGAEPVSATVPRSCGLFAPRARLRTEIWVGRDGFGRLAVDSDTVVVVLPLVAAACCTPR